MTPELQDDTQKQHEWEATVPKKRVQKLIGMLLWVSRCTRADVSFATSRLASAVARWYSVHEELAKQVVGYLKKTSWQALRFFPPNPNKKIYLELHTDASWHMPRSQSGHVLVRIQYDEDDANPQVLATLDWSSSKQSLSADSSASSELVAAHGGVRVSLPLAIGLELIVGHKVGERIPIRLRIDNEAVVQICRTGSTKGLAWMETKPFCIRAGCINDYITFGVLEVKYVGTLEQLADLHTKALCKVKLGAILDKLRLVDGTPGWGGAKTHVCDGAGAPAGDAGA